MTERKNYSKEFKVEAVRLLELGEMPAAQLARELGVRHNQLYKWQSQLSTMGLAAFAGGGRRKPDSSVSETAVAELGMQHAITVTLVFARKRDQPLAQPGVPVRLRLVGVA
jgi:transposase-like protein